MNNNINWLEVFNSSTTFGVLAAIAFGIMFLLLKKDVSSKPARR